MTNTPNQLHIISFDIPYPPDYGGVIDVFYKIKALHAQGINITLHAFRYNDRTAAPELEAYCEKIYYYDRKMHPLSMFSRSPFIVASRQVAALLVNLCADDAPILFEGLHSCGFAGHPKLKDRFKIVRMHNVEWQYYAHLCTLEPTILKKMYFRTESEKLKKLEKRLLPYLDAVLTIAPEDQKYFEENYPDTAQKFHFIPPFHPNEALETTQGKGKFALFHGKLSVSDNEKAALALVHIFRDLDTPLSIAGKNPTKRLRKAVQSFPHISLIADPSEAEMNTLIRTAHIHVLLSFQQSGMKLKLLNALFRGRFVITNSILVQGSGLENYVIIEDDYEKIGEKVQALMSVEFSEAAYKNRLLLLKNRFSNNKNAQNIVNIIKKDTPQYSA